MPHANRIPDRRSLLAKAKSANIDGEEYLRDVAFHQLLKRVEATSPDTFLVKGSQALRVRKITHRRTVDLDMLAPQVELDRAVEELRRCATTDLADGLQFQVVNETPIAGQDIGGSAGTRVRLECLHGALSLTGLKIDVVVGRTPSGAISHTAVPQYLSLTGVDAVRVALYPIEDHVADKVSAIMTTYGAGRSSTRVRDLYDLCAIAMSSPVAAEPLHAALSLEHARRGLQPTNSLQIPRLFQQNWPKMIASGSPLDNIPHRYRDAAMQVALFVNPILDRTVVSGSWNPRQHAWLH